MGEKIYSYHQMRVFQNAMRAAMEIFQLTKTFPNEEKYSLIDQIRRSSRSVCANLAEAWRKRQYRAAFVAKLVEAESEANETQVWLEFAERCGYLNVARAGEISRLYDQVLGQLILIKEQPDKWTISASGDREKRVRL